MRSQNREELLETLNRYNKKYKTCKYYIDDEETDSNETRHTIAMLMRDIAVACVVLAAVLLIPSPVGSHKNRLANNDASADFMLNMMSKNVASKDSQSDDSKTMSAAACADSINAMVKKAKADKSSERLG